MDFFQYVSDNESSGNSVEWKINYYTFHRCTDVPQYVRGDASSDDCDGWKIYYKHHMYMEIVQHVRNDTSSKWQAQRMIYHTHHMYMDAL